MTTPEHRIRLAAAARGRDLSALRQAGENLRVQLRQIRHDARYVVQDVADLWPWMLRTTADRDLERVARDAFEDGVQRERYDAEQKRAAPAAGGVIRVWREALGVTVAEVAERVGVEAEYLERVEKGEDVTPKEFSRRLSKILGEWAAEAHSGRVPA